MTTEEQIQYALEHYNKYVEDEQLAKKKNDEIARLKRIVRAKENFDKWKEIFPFLEIEEETGYYLICGLKFNTVEDRWLVTDIDIEIPVSRVISSMNDLSRLVNAVERCLSKSSKEHRTVSIVLPKGWTKERLNRLIRVLEDD